MPSCVQLRPLSGSSVELQTDSGEAVTTSTDRFLPGALLYSVNPLMKMLVQERFFGDLHYVWCSESCDSGSADRYTVASLVPPSSNPRDIYGSLRSAVERLDTHNDMIVRVRAFYAAFSSERVKDGKMTDGDRDELVYMITHSELRLWRPVLYVIPRASVDARLQSVAASKRAGHGPEYIIEDLRREEFDRVEL